MKKHFLNISRLGIIVLLLLLETACFRRAQIVETQRPASPPRDEIYDSNDVNEQTSSASYQIFYDDLSPYGSWIDYGRYGYVWIPRVSGDFHPYATDGHWVMTHYGWTWVSDFRWGWAAFHYGRWAYESFYGWMWIPGRVWGPAWVAWRESPDYFGWAPLGPFVDITVSVGVSCPFDHYRFVPRRHFTDRYVHRYYRDWHGNTVIINQTTVINETHVVNNNRYYYGPRKEIVEKSVGQKVRTAEIQDNNKPDADVVENDRIKVYRPRIDENMPTDARKPTPKRVVPATDLQPVPADKRLTPNVKREPIQNTEGGGIQPQDRQPRRDDVPQERPDVKKEPMQKVEPRLQDRQPRRDEVPQERPDVKKEPMPRVEPRPQDRQPRRDDIPQRRPEVQKQPVPKTEPRPQDRQPRRNDVPQEQPTKTQPKTEKPTKEKTTPQPVKQKETPPKTKNRENNN